MLTLIQERTYAVRTISGLMLGVFLIALGSTAVAQDFPKAEVFGGYSYLRSAGNANFNGWHGQLAFNMNRWFGLAADFSGHYQTGSEEVNRVRASNHAFLFGPQVTDRVGKISGFAHALFGGTMVDKGFLLIAGGIPEDTTSFTMAFGGGIDVGVSDAIAVRVFQVDYVRMRVESPITGDAKGANNFRVSVGVVFKIQ